jgi:hypothetical protein
MDTKAKVYLKCLIHDCENQGEIRGLCVPCYRSAWRNVRANRISREDPRPDEEGQSATDPLARFATIQRRRRQLESDLAALKNEARELEQKILDDWADRGQRRAAVDGLCVFVRSEMYCAKKPEISGREMARVLTLLGLGQLVGYNATGLKRHVRQRLAAAKQRQGIQDDIPQGIVLDAVLSPELAAMITLGETVRLRTRLSK